MLTRCKNNQSSSWDFTGFPNRHYKSCQLLVVVCSDFMDMLRRLINYRIIIINCEFCVNFFYILLWKFFIPKSFSCVFRTFDLQIFGTSPSSLLYTMSVCLFEMCLSVCLIYQQTAHSHVDQSRPVTRVPMTKGSGISSGRSLNSVTSAAFLCCSRRTLWRRRCNAERSSAKNEEEHLQSQ